MISPSAPSSASCFARMVAGRKRLFITICEYAPLSRAAAAMRRALSSVTAMGLSRYTCFPAFRSATAISSCSALGVHTETTSMSSRVRIVRQSVV